MRERTAELIALRRQLHQFPELSNEEFETTSLLASRLREEGFEVHVRPEGTGFYADIAPDDFDPHTQKTVAVRCDLDALAIEEANEVEYRSRRPGVMHACGHDVHMTCTVGVGEVLNVRRNELPGRLRLVFQHAEEMVGGAEDMIRFGAMEGVDYVLGVHVDPELDVGIVGVRHGVFTAAFDEFKFRIIGRSGHGARPHHCVDPIFVVTQLSNALYNALSRSVDARDPMVLSIGQISGGQAPNIIPELAAIAGSIRTLSREHRAAVEPLLVRLADGVCGMYGARYELDLRHGAPAIINDVFVTDQIAAVTAALFGDDAVHWIPLPSMGSEDFSFFVERAPGAMFRLGVASERPKYFLHSARFDVDERAIAVGSKVLASTALRLMQTDRQIPD